MTDTLTTRAPTTPAPAATPKTSTPRHNIRRFALGLAAAWAVPAAANLVGVDILVLPLLWLATAGLFRTGSTLTDRLIPALGVLAGATILTGYLTTVWPFGLHPIPLAGLAGTVLTVIAAVTGRRLALPRRLLGSDLILAGGALTATYLMAHPGTGLSGLGWTGFAAINGDRLRQFNLFDTVRHLGGFPALTPDAAAPILEPSMLHAYPPGMHYLYAVIDAFWTGGNDPGTALDELTRYYWYVLGSFGLLVAVVAWAARWIAGPQAAGWKRGLFTTAITVFLTTGVYSTMIWEGFDAQIAGMVFTVVLIAVLARPPRHPTEHLLVVGFLTIAVTYTYTLYAVFAAIGVIASAVAHRHRLRRHLRIAIPVAAVFGALASLQLLIPAVLYGFDSTSHINAGGYIVPVPDAVLYGATALTAAAVLTPSIRRSPRLQILAAVCATGWAFALALHWYNLGTVGYVSYYYYKTAHMLGLILIVTAAAALVHLRPTWTRPRLLRGKPRTTRLTAATAAVLAALLLSGAIPWTLTEEENLPATAGKIELTDARRWYYRWTYANHTGALQYLHDRGMVADGTPTLVLFSPNGGSNQHLSLLLATLNHDLGRISPQVNATALTGTGHPDPRTAFTRFTDALAASPVPLRVVTNDAVSAERLTALRDTHPELELELHYLPDMPGETTPVVVNP